MKMVIAIINKDDSSKMTKVLAKNGYSATKIGSTGGFLLSGNTTYLIGVENDKVDALLKLIEEHTRERVQLISPTLGYGVDVHSTYPLEVKVGGATIFVIDVERFEKV